MRAQEQQCRGIIRDHLKQSMGATDLIALSGAQLRMLAEVATIYGADFQERRVKVLVASLLGYIIPSTLSFGSIGSLLPAIQPAMDSPWMALFGGASTRAVGKVFLEHLESGGTFLNFEPSALKEYFQQEFEAGRRLVAHLGAETEAEVPVLEPSF